MGTKGVFIVGLVSILLANSVLVREQEKKILVSI